MLFLTVYGPELESLFSYICKHNYLDGNVNREQLYAAYVPRRSASSKGQTKNLDDALHYLLAAGLVTIDGDKITPASENKKETNMPFSALLLRQLRWLEHNHTKLSTLDQLYIMMLEHLYVLPNRIWLDDVHAVANQLDLAYQVGGISQEKVNAWKRVMEFLGVGYRVGSGFYCLYRPELLSFVTQQWSQTEGTLQEFFENHLQFWLPCLSARGEVALSVAHTLDQLALNRQIHLYSKQDSPSKSYFGSRQLKGIQIL